MPVGLASSTGLPGLSSPSSPLTLTAPAMGLFFLNVAGTISAGTPKQTVRTHDGVLTKFLH